MAAFQFPDQGGRRANQSAVVNIRILREAIEATDPLRHGRPSVRAPDPSDIDALAALDHHHALRRLDTVELDLNQVRAEAEDLVEWGRSSREPPGLCGAVRTAPARTRSIHLSTTRHVDLPE